MVAQKDKLSPSPMELTPCLGALRDSSQGALAPAAWAGTAPINSLGMGGDLHFHWGKGRGCRFDPVKLSLAKYLGSNVTGLVTGKTL